jgi:hypothetical protein
VKPEVVKERVQHYVLEYTKAALEIRPGDRGAVQKYICLVWPEEEHRHRNLGWLFDATRLRMVSLSDASILALKRWIGATKVGDEWVPATGFTTEAEWIDWTAHDAAFPAESQADSLQEAIVHNTMLKVDGVTQHCPECGANVFNKLSDGHYQCNGCRALYTGEKAEAPEKAPKHADPPLPGEIDLLQTAIAEGGTITETGTDPNYHPPETSQYFTFDD